MAEREVHVQYGAGSEAVEGWINYDASPTLLVQRIPLVGKLIRSKVNCVFDDQILYGNVVKGLPLLPCTVDGLFCSHILEHLSYSDCLTALKNSYEYLRYGGRFRILVPDLAIYISEYQNASTSVDASFEFMTRTGLGLHSSRKTFKKRLVDSFGNSAHRCMWDYNALRTVLSECGFVDINRFEQGKCEDQNFLKPERDHQFFAALAIECSKPK